jgi:hypothetical protein
VILEHLTRDAGRLDMNEPVYAVRYIARGAGMAYGAAMLTAGAGALAGIALEQWTLLVPSLAVVAAAERIRPYLGEHPQIRLDTNGMTLHGFGFLPWRAVGKARAFERTTNEGVRAWLMFEIRAEAAQRAGHSWGRLQVRPWRLIGGRGLILRLEGLDDQPDSIRRAFERFSKRRIAVDRV